MGLVDGLTWGPVKGHASQVLPFEATFEDPSDWLLFASERRAVPRPWQAGTLMLVNSCTRMNRLQQKLFAELAEQLPAVKALTLLNCPQLVMSEHISDRYTVGSGWVLVDAGSDSTDDVGLSSQCSPKRMRFMEYKGDDLMGNLILSFEMDHDLVLFTHVREIDGRRNACYSGYVNRKTRDAWVLNRTLDYLSCDNCVQKDETCLCDDETVRVCFEQRSLQRRQFAQGFGSSKANLGTEYSQNWMNGRRCSFDINSGMSAFSYDVRLVNEGNSFEQAVVFVIQNEVISINPPRASQRLINSLLSSDNSDEESRFVEIQDEGGHQEEFDFDRPHEIQLLDRGVRMVSLKSESESYGVSFENAVSMGKYSNVSMSPVRMVSLKSESEGYGVSFENAANMGKYSSVSMSPMTTFETVDEGDGQPSPEMLDRPFNPLMDDGEGERADSGPSSSGSRRVTDRPRIFTCDKCNLTFRRRYDVNRHNKTVHEKRRDFECKECGKRFSQSGHLNEHMNVRHMGTASHRCEYCKKCFGAKSKLRRHIKTVHENLRNFPCEACDKSFKDVYSLKYHTSTQHGDLLNQSSNLTL